MGMHIEELREMLCDELDKIAGQGELTAGSLETVDKLTHSIKSIDTIMAMDSAGYSNEGPYWKGGGTPYVRNGARRMYSRNSYERGIGRSRSRDYSRGDGKDEMIEQLEELMEEAYDSKTKEAIKRAIHQISD